MENMDLSFYVLSVTAVCGFIYIPFMDLRSEDEL